MYYKDGEFSETVLIGNGASVTIAGNRTSGYLVHRDRKPIKRYETIKDAIDFISQMEVPDPWQRDFELRRVNQELGEILKNTRPLFVEVSPDLREALDRIASERKVSLSDVVRDALGMYVRYAKPQQQKKAGVKS